MSVRNTLSKAQNDKVVEYQVGEEVVKLSPGIVRNYLVSGNGAVTDQEIVMFINLCRFQHLNPFLREAYLIKFGNKPAQMVVGKDAITKRAKRNPEFAGYQAGIIVQNPETKAIERRDGSFYIPGEIIVGGWSKVYIKGYEVPIESAVAFNEYVGTKSDGTVNNQWASKPGTMIRKVALVQALREAFPEDLAGLYDQSEMGMEIVEEPPVDVAAIDAPKEEPKKLDEYRQRREEQERIAEEIEAQEMNEMLNFDESEEPLQGIF